MTDKAKLAFPISAGGVVYRLQENTPEILICGRHQAGGWLWALPKGTPEAGEAIPNTALREVLEETGLEVKFILIEPGPIKTNIRKNAIDYFERWIDCR